MLAYREYRNGICSSCGQPLAESTHPDNDGWYDTFELPPCHSCTAISRHRDPGAEPNKDVLSRLTRDYRTNPLPPRELFDGPVRPTNAMTVPTPERSVADS